MKENRQKLESILKSDYSNTDKLFREQLIKTKVRHTCLCEDPADKGRSVNTPTMIWRSTVKRLTSQFSAVQRRFGPHQLTASAILKYHSIKMDEINDTIGHLWNKTYQGTGELRPPLIRQVT